ncbi:MAG: histidinol-phosphate transaminase [Actinomycetota bacterium]|nr:histidinol-phosphate transaminase [Actinomycetota bacterium]
MSVPVRPAIAELTAYKPGRSAADLARELGLPEAIKLASNEVAYPPLPSVVAAIAEAACIVNRYPDNGSLALTVALAQRFDVPVESIAVGCGSVSLCQQLLQSYTVPGNEVLCAWRSFEAYPLLVTVAGATLRPVPLLDHTHDPEAMAAALTSATRLVFICNPNNPTGTALDTAAITGLLDAIGPETLIVIDEAYREFVTDPDIPDGRDLMRGRANVCVLRTFSKAYGLAGLRVGYLLSENPEIATAVRKTYVPFSVSSLAQVAALASLSAQDEMRERCAAVVSERGRVSTALAALDLPVPPSHANFIWLPLGADAQDFAGFCEARGVIVRPFAGDGARVTIGRPEENDAFLEATRDWRSA